MFSISKISCFCSNPTFIFAVIISATLFGSDIVLTLLTTSIETFLLIFWYSWNCSIINFCNAFILELFFFAFLISVTEALIKSLLKLSELTLTLKVPSTSTFKVPSGNLSSCKTLATVPYEYKFFSLGLSISEFLKVIIFFYPKSLHC